MFKCAKCKEIQPPRTKAYRVVVESRPVTYKEGGKGHEAVREADFCESCFNKLLTSVSR